MEDIQVSILDLLLPSSSTRSSSSMTCRGSRESRGSSHRTVADQIVFDKVFGNGQNLHPYQAEDLKMLIRRERGEYVCGGEEHNDTGYLVAYPMGFVSIICMPRRTEANMQSRYGKTALTIALIASNPPPRSFNGCRATLSVSFPACVRF